MKRSVVFFAGGALVAIAIAGPSLTANRGGLVVNGQRWETDFSRAKARAVEEGKVILHLQSFGKPGDPSACTNTRILTATLLKDPEFAGVLKQSVPSWELVREAAKVTIDLGNGKVLHRTLRGNTCLYVLKPDGTVVDAFPGVFDPKALLPQLQDSIKHASLSAPELKKWHEEQRLKYPPPFGFGVAASKSVVERPLLDGAVRNPSTNVPNRGGGFVRQGRFLPSFEQAASQMYDISAMPAPTIFSPAGGTPTERGLTVLRQESASNLNQMRYVIHSWLASLDQPVSAPDAKQTMFEKILHIDYTDPYYGLKNVELPGTPD